MSHNYESDHESPEGKRAESRSWGMEGGLGFSRMDELFNTQRNLRKGLLNMQLNLHECLYCLFYFSLRMYSCLGKGECDVMAMSHVLAMSHVVEGSHVPAMVCQPTLIGMPANGGWRVCQRWLANLPTVVGEPANGGWQVR